VTGQLSTANATDFRVTGQATSSVATDFRVTGQATSFVAQDFKLVGASPEVAVTRDFRLTGKASATNTVDFKLVGEIQTALSIGYKQAALVNANGYWPLTESSAGPFNSIVSGGGSLNAVSTPTASTAAQLFAGETYLQLDSGDGVQNYSAAVDPNNFGMAGWFWIDSLPGAGRVVLMGHGDFFNAWSSHHDLVLRSDGKLAMWCNGVEYGLSNAVLQTGR